MSETPKPRIPHGDPLQLENGRAANALVENAGEPLAPPSPNASQSWPFDYIFPELARDDSNTLAGLKEINVVECLKALGDKHIVVDDPEKIPGVPTPTIYTFFGQFVDHDITHEKGTEPIVLAGADLLPLSFEKVRTLRNSRSPNLELDSVYGSVSGVIPPRDSKNPEKLRIDAVSEPQGRPPCTSEINDLPRWHKTDNPKTDRVALIGDIRNDENIVTAQLHVAFLHAHNALIDRGYSFAKARKKLIQHYQWIVLEDFLPRVADSAVVKKIRTRGAKFFRPSREKFFTPLEFSVAAYRFGHSKVRQTYVGYNEVLPPVDLNLLFTFTRYSGTLAGNLNTHIIGQWIIDWKNFLNSDNSDFFSRPIDTLLSLALLDLDIEQGVVLPEWKKNLAVRNLLRGYLLRMPTGQAVATEMNKKDQSIVPLTPSQIASAVTKPQYAIMEKAGFHEHTPLWFYVLAEAAYYNKGYHLGPVGSTIVAETLIGILRYSDYSILSKPGWQPTLGLTPGKFDLEDLLEVAGVYDPRG
jgi:Animal haem peroxidase